MKMGILCHVSFTLKSNNELAEMIGTYVYQCFGKMNDYFQGEMLFFCSFLKENEKSQTTVSYFMDPNFIIKQVLFHFFL